jgi:cytoskeleton protein RodZ
MSPEDSPGGDRGYTVSAGNVLRKAREALGLSLEEVASELRLSAYQIRALEDDDYADLPGATYVRGYLRAYARVLNLDEDHIVRSASLPGGEGQGTVDQDTVGPEVRPGSRTAPRAMVALLAVVLIGAVVVWWYGRDDGLVSLMQGDRASSSPARSTAAEGRGYQVLPGESGTLSADGAGMPSTKRRAIFYFDEQSWIDVRDGSGKVLVQRTVAPGLTLAVEGDPPFRVFLGNAAAVRVDYDGEPHVLAPRKDGLYARFTLGVGPAVEQAPDKD